jgi:DNA-binding response OmpR family regulator
METAIVVNETILIVDDSLTVRMDLAEAFEVVGFSVMPCADIATARDALSRVPIGLVVLDVVLPDGDGVEFLKEIRAAAPLAQIPILMLSSEAEVKDRIRGLKTGATEYVGKPYDTGYVVARAQELLHLDSGKSDKASILVIDDSATFREELSHALMAAGYKVMTAQSGEDGLRIAASSRPSAIVVDGIMTGIDGATVIRKIRLDAVLRDTPCVLLTGSEDRGSELRALDAGADAFVRKEEPLDVILARLAAVLRSVAAPNSAKTASLMSPKKILAVDDSATYLNELADVLRGEGYDVVPARSGEEALEMLAVQPVDCILMDLQMPGMGGRDACRQIKMSGVFSDVPLIMLTAVEDRNAMIDALSLGADDFVQKSSDFDVLKARIRAQMRRKQFEDEQRRIREELLHKELEAIEAKAAQTLAEAKLALLDQLERKNKELEAFSYSISHDLRAPLRVINGFSLALLEDYNEKFDEAGRDYLARVLGASKRMGELIDDLLQLSKISRADVLREPVDLSALASDVFETLTKAQPGNVQIEIQQGLAVEADRRLLRIVLENLISNAVKFSSKIAAPHVTVGTELRADATIFFVRDNGAGFDMSYAQKLFQPFQRMHRESDFPGTGIGLSIVRRVVERHGGEIWAESEVGHGASFFFTLPLEESL